MLLKLWFDSVHSKELWYCGTKVELADSKLLQIKPPLNITRTPRSIQQHRSYWKASEYRNWLLFYSLPVMYSILPIEYLAHHMLLVEAVHTLLQCTITTTMINKVEKLIQHYCFKFQFYYSERYMTANVHYLLHLPMVVQNLGPLFAYSCFPYEGTNGHLLSCIKGTQHVDSQILETVSISQGIAHIAEQYLPSDTAASQFYRNMKATRHESNKLEIKESERCYALGQVNYCPHLINRSHQIALFKITNSKKLATFNRAMVHGNIYHSLQHKQPKKRNSYTVTYDYNKNHFHGEILYFVTDFSQIFAVIIPFVNEISVFPDDNITYCSVPHIHVYGSKSQSVHVISASCIDLCVAINFEESPNTTYITEQPNDIEKD